MWKSIFSLFFALIPFLSFAQLVEAPLQNNPVLQLQNNSNSEQNAVMPNCPNLNGNYNYLFKNDSLDIKIDTAGIGFSVNPAFTILDCDGVSPIGEVSIDGDYLIYKAGDFDGFSEKVCLEYCPDEGDCSTLEYTFVTQRTSQTHILDVIQINEESTLENICLDEDLLPGTLECNIFYYCSNSAGNELASQAWMTYNEPTSCLKYTAGLGQGVDTVCAILCDEYGVCDYYKVPFEIQSYNLDLPFWDDFSNNDGPYTSSEKWVTKDGFVNNTMAELPKSVGLVTLDGLDHRGTPYLETGRADHLTSRGLNLGNTGNQQVNLKFFYTEKGNGLYPNGPDNLSVEFRDNAGIWHEEWSISGLESSTDINESPAFKFKEIAISGDEYLYDGFQFRFVNKVSPVGLYDLWHIDYVRVAAGEGADSTFNDVAFVDIPNSLLLEYEHMPWKHFLADINNQIVVQDFESVFYNHKTTSENPANDSDILLRERTTNTNIPVNLNVIDGVNVDPLDYSFFSNTLEANNVGDIINTITGQLSDLEKAELELSYSFTLTAQEQINDQVSRIHRFDNYFAYDDGTAERQIYLENPQTDNPSLALEFESKLDDTLKAVQFHFPHINGNVENQLFSIHIYLDDLSSEPAQSMEFLSPIYADSYFDTLQGYTTYLIKDIFGQPAGLPLAAGQKFYIAFQQLSSTNFGVPIGLDINRDVSSKLYLNVWNIWTNQEGIIQGSPMIRAVVGNEDVIPTQTSSIEESFDLKIFPNPNSGIINLELSNVKPNTSCKIYDQFGKLVKVCDFRERIVLDELTQGMYFLNLDSSEGLTYAKTKFVIIR
jgi:hypothetical protein